MGVGKERGLLVGVNSNEAYAGIDDQANLYFVQMLVGIVGEASHARGMG